MKKMVRIQTTYYDGSQNTEHVNGDLSKLAVEIAERLRSAAANPLRQRDGFSMLVTLHDPPQEM